MVEGQHETPQFRTKVTAHSGRQWGNQRPPVRRQPALTPVTNRVCPQHQILDDIVLVALEVRAQRSRQREYLLLINAQAGILAAAPALIAGRWLFLAALCLSLHAAGLELRATLQALQPGDLLAQRRILLLEHRYALQKLQHQGFQLRGRNLVQIKIRYPHNQRESQHHASRQPQVSPPSKLLPGVMPLLQILGLLALTAWASQPHRAPAGVQSRVTCE